MEHRNQGERVNFIANEESKREREREARSVKLILIFNFYHRQSSADFNHTSGYNCEYNLKK